MQKLVVSVFLIIAAIAALCAVANENKSAAAIGVAAILAVAAIEIFGG